jgi:hypothetical protein
LGDVAVQSYLLIISSCTVCIDTYVKKGLRDSFLNQRTSLTLSPGKVGVILQGNLAVSPSVTSTNFTGSENKDDIDYFIRNKCPVKL